MVRCPSLIPPCWQSRLGLLRKTTPQRQSASASASAAAPVAAAVAAPVASATCSEAFRLSAFPGAQLHSLQMLLSSSLLTGV